MARAGITVEHEHDSLELDPDLCEKVLRHVARSEGARIKELTLILSDHASVHALNRDYLNHDYITDVLAFDYGESDVGEGEICIEGEIYVDLDTASERHAEFGVGFMQEALRYAVHGLLHLIGYRDSSEPEKEEMHALEEKYLNEMKIEHGAEHDSTSRK